MSRPGTNPTCEPLDRRNRAKIPFASMTFPHSRGTGIIKTLSNFICNFIGPRWFILFRWAREFLISAYVKGLKINYILQKACVNPTKIDSAATQSSVKNEISWCIHLTLSLASTKPWPFMNTTNCFLAPPMVRSLLVLANFNADVENWSYRFD